MMEIQYQVGVMHQKFQSVEDYSEEDVIKVAKEADYKTYKVFPGEEYSGGLIICAIDCEIEIIKDMIMKFYGVEAEIVEYPEEEKRGQ